MSTTTTTPRPVSGPARSTFEYSIEHGVREVLAPVPVSGPARDAKTVTPRENRGVQFTPVRPIDAHITVRAVIVIGEDHGYLYSIHIGPATIVRGADEVAAISWITTLGSTVTRACAVVARAQSECSIAWYSPGGPGNPIS